MIYFIQLFSLESSQVRTGSRNEQLAAPIAKLHPPRSGVEMPKENRCATPVDSTSNCTR